MEKEREKKEIAICNDFLHSIKVELKYKNPSRKTVYLWYDRGCTGGGHPTSPTIHFVVYIIK